jgi:hypothetical protein
MHLQHREFSADLFATNRARLYKHTTDMTLDFCVYILENTYETPITKKHRQTGRNFAVSFHSEENNAKLSLVAVRYINNELVAAPASCVHETENFHHLENFKPTGAYLPISNPDRFLEEHKEHIKLYGLDKLMKSEAYTNLVAHAATLRSEGQGTDGYRKHKAIEALLSQFRHGNLQTALDMMSNKENSTYNAMVAPRPNYWLCFNFTANDPTETKTFRLLSAIIASEDFQELVKRYFDRRVAYVPIA